jgi:hypothetical protein
MSYMESLLIIKQFPKANIAKGKMVAGLLEEGWMKLNTDGTF